MTSRELKKCLKKLAFGLIFIILLIVILLIYTLGGKKAELSIYTNSGYVENNLQALGINENEIKQYLSIFGNCIDPQENETQKMLNMATNFIKDMCSFYEVQTNENGLNIYDADIVNQVVREVKGTDLAQDFEKNESYAFDQKQNVYIQNQNLDDILYCTEIQDTKKQDNEIEITYCLANMTEEQMAKYQMGQEVQYEKRTIKVMIKKNENYEYSKYSIIHIEEI